MGGPKSKHVNLVSCGRLAPGHDQRQVVRRLRHRFKLDVSQATRLLTEGVVLKQQLDYPTARQYSDAFMQLGLEVEIQPFTRLDAANNEHLSNKKRSSPKRITKAYLDSVFSEDISRAPVKKGYKLGLVSVALLSMVAPAIYIGSILVLVSGLYGYLVVVPQWWGEIGGGFAKLLLLIVLPVTMLVLIMFMVKPIVARRGHSQGYDLDWEDAPAFYYLVELMCRRIGVPVPAIIQIDNRVNASAGSANGLLGLLRGQLILTVGLPLIAGINARQLVGVLAHEFGHFAQPSAMFAYYLITTINGWFADLAYNDDPWDRRLLSWKEHAGYTGAAYLVVKFAQWGIHLTRLLLSQLYLVNLRVTRYMSRQMEYDADRYEAYVAGSDSFKGSSLHLRALSYADHLVAEINQQAWDQNKLLSDIPLAVAWQSRQFSSEVLCQLEEGMAKEETNVWDSHPADYDRVNHAEALQLSAVFKDSFEARQFFPKLEKLSTEITLYEYRLDGVQEPESFVVDNAEVLAINKTLAESERSLESYFNGVFTHRLMQFELPRGEDLRTMNLQATIDWLRLRLLGYADKQKDLVSIHNRYREMALGECYLNAGVRIEPEKFYLADKNLQQAGKTILAEQAAQAKCQVHLDHTDAMFYQRIRLTVLSMENREKQRCLQLMGTLHSISQLRQIWILVDYHTFLLEALLSNETEDIIAVLRQPVNQYADHCRKNFEKLLALTTKIPDRMDATDGGNLSDFIISWTGGLPGELQHVDAEFLVGLCDQALRAIQYQYVWLLGELTTYCEKQEQRLGVRPIKLVGELNKR